LAPDVVFMDIHMPHTSGLDLMDALADRDFYLVFTTAFDRYAVEALRTRAFDYLLKPIDRDDLQACARRILMHFYHHRTPGQGALSPATRRLEILTSGKRHFVRHRDIVRVEAEGSYTTLHLAGGKRITMSKNLKRVEEMLNNEMFFRAHNSHLVQLDRIVACNYRENCVTLDNGSEVPMAVRKREALKRKLSLLMPA
ncbi:MAG: LytR/AlgR family response regulator transcription factor, partial [Flavobacteriales bacterium]